MKYIGQFPCWCKQKGRELCYLKCLWSKNNCYLFARLFRVKKNGVFLFGMSFFVLEMFTFLYYANEESDDVIGGSMKTAQHSIENNSRNIKAVFFALGTSNVHHNKKEWHPLCCCHGNTVGSSLFLWKTKYPHLQPFKWVRGSCSEHTWFPYCLYSPYWIGGSGWSLFKIKSENFSHN